MGKTANELSTEKLRTYRPLQALETFRSDPAVAKRRAHAWSVARAAADVLRNKYGATRIVVFGSLGRKTLFTPWSDIDLAVWGIKPELYLSAADAVMDMGLNLGIKVDLVEAENCSEAVYVDIELDGIEI
jgi:uncharacterized protein